jgi:hypothetical protein
MTKWWWPAQRGYWPPDVPREVTIDAFLRMFETLGYMECTDGNLEANYEKIVVYAKINAMGVLEPTHGARQLVDGSWTSKLGVCEDITHQTTNALDGNSYGSVVKFMSRPR